MPVPNLFIQGRHVQRNIAPAFSGLVGIGLVGIEGRNATLFITVEGAVSQARPTFCGSGSEFLGSQARPTFRGWISSLTSQTHFSWMWVWVSRLASCGCGSEFLVPQARPTFRGCESEFLGSQARPPFSWKRVWISRLANWTHFLWKWVWLAN